MALELGVLLGAVGAVNTLVREIAVTTQAIRSGFMSKNDEAKQQLADKLQQLQDNLKLTGELSSAAESYFKTYENVLELLSLCRRAERFVKDNMDDLRNRTNRDYAGNWKVLESMFDTIDSRRDTPQKVVLDRAQWYDKEDKLQIDRELMQFTTSFERAKTNLKHRAADSLASEMENTNRSLQAADTLLRNTLYEKILKTLHKLGS